MSEAGSYRDELSNVVRGEGMRIALVVARFNSTLTEQMLASASRTLIEKGVADAAIDIYRVPGAWELPQMVDRVAHRGRVDAIIAIGAVIRGDTPHFDYIAGECTRGLGQIGIDHDVPVIFGVLTTDTVEQAEERADPSRMDKGREFALAALEMAALFKAT